MLLIVAATFIGAILGPSVSGLSLLNVLAGSFAGAMVSVIYSLIFHWEVPNLKYEVKSQE